MTDGDSDSESLTTDAAKRMHSADITAFAIGVGSSLNKKELKAIASEPECTHLILLPTGFNEMSSIVSVIQKKARKGEFVINGCLSNCLLLEILFIASTQT
jgi:sialic acid synthase SpsE